MTSVVKAATATPAVSVAAGPAGLAKANATRATGFLACLAILALCVLASLAVGAKSLPVSTVWDALFTGDGSEAGFIVRELRMPRTMLAVLVGAALGVAGALIQALTRNPLADPGILGVNAGAGFAVTIGVAFFGTSSITNYLWLSFAGAILVTVTVYALGSVRRAGPTPIRLTLVGVAVGALLGGISSGVTFLNPSAFDSMRFWAAGSLAGRGWDILTAVVPFIVAGLCLAMLASRPLNAIALGEDLARAVGAHIVQTRAIVIIAVTLLAGAATAAVGPIGFVGLMVPHVVR